MPYRMEEISLYGPNGKPDWFWKLNPRGTVPVLVCHGGAVIHADSDRILDEIGNDVEGGSRIVPKDNVEIERAQSFRTLLNEFLPIGKKAVLAIFDAKPTLRKGTDPECEFARAPDIR